VIAVTFQEWIGQLVADRYGGVKSRLAELLDMDLSVFSRGVASGTFDIDNLFRLAEVTDTPAVDILRLANKPETANMIERLQRAGLFPISRVAAAKRLTASQREVLAEWKHVSVESRKALLHLMRREHRHRQPLEPESTTPPDPQAQPRPPKAARHG
jgi:hypothetical protein